MMHNPCGQRFNKKAKCCDENGNCTKKFPKPFTDETVMRGRGYPGYRCDAIGHHLRLRSLLHATAPPPRAHSSLRSRHRRRPRGNKVPASVYVDGVRTTVEQGNEWVVPYNPRLLLEFGAHANLEIYQSIG